VEARRRRPPQQLIDIFWNYSAALLTERGGFVWLVVVAMALIWSR
jgi:hypothetical protein